MSNFVNVPLGKDVVSMDITPEFQPYSGVEIIVNDDYSIFVGNRSGRVLSITNPWGTRQQAENILASLESTGFQYQPYTASGALLNPAAEIGDGVTLNGVYSGIYKMSKRFDSLMQSDIEAPQDEELDHEYPFEPQKDRVYRREIADAQASISLNKEAITAEVTRATAAEGSLSSRITQNATSINAKVSQTGGNNSSFGWSLLSNKFSLFAGSKEVFKCTSSGVEIQGKITATSGAIGGFTIGSSAIYNGMTTLNSTSSGVYVGTNGISVGGGAFKVTSGGSVSAKNMTLTGTLNIGGTNITAAALRSGAQSAYNNSGSWTTGSGYGYNYNNATKQSGGSYPSFFKASVLSCGGFVCSGNGITVNGLSASWRTKSFYDGNGNYVIMQYLGAN